MDEQDKQYEAYKVCLDTRKFEIELFWKRSLFFWGFIAVAFAGYSQLYTTNNPILPLVLAGFGLVCTVAWTLANRGSKYWQENWEQKVARLEPGLTGVLFEKQEKVKTEAGKWLQARRYSVSRLTIALGDYVCLLWIVLLIHKGLLMWGSETVQDWVVRNGPYLLLAMPLLFIGLMLWRCMSSKTGDAKASDYSDFQEQLASLYLRLNGYFVSGFIAHAPEGYVNKETEPRSVRTEVDILAVRFPYNSEPEREVKPSEYLRVSKTHIDVLICEVKGREQALQFNEGLRENYDAILSVLRWIGILEEQEAVKLVSDLKDLLSTQYRNSPDAFRELVPNKNYRIRAIFFAPDCERPKECNQPRYVFGQEMLQFIWQCLRPTEERSGCQVRYDFGLWGPYEKIVRCFKEAQEPFASVNELYEAVEKMEQEASGSSTTNSGV